MVWSRCVNCAELKDGCQTTTAGALCLRCRGNAHRVEEKIFVGRVVFTRVLRDDPAKRAAAAAVFFADKA